MKRIIALVLGLVLVGNVFALDFGKVEGVWEKSLDIANTQLDNLDFDIPRAEDVEAKVNNEMYITELESKVKQQEAEIRLLEKENSRLKELLKIYELKENNENEEDSLRYKSLYE